MPDFPDLYALLGVSPRASDEEIRSAYKRLSRVHPDVNRSPIAAAMFRTLAEAYDILRDKEGRALYDAHVASLTPKPPLAEPPKPPPPAPPRPAPPRPTPRPAATAPRKQWVPSPPPAPPPRRERPRQNPWVKASRDIWAAVNGPLPDPPPRKTPPPRRRGSHEYDGLVQVILLALIVGFAACFRMC